MSSAETDTDGEDEMNVEEALRIQRARVQHLEREIAASPVLRSARFCRRYGTSAAAIMGCVLFASVFIILFPVLEMVTAADLMTRLNGTTTATDCPRPMLDQVALSLTNLVMLPLVVVPLCIGTFVWVDRRHCRSYHDV